jgi:hypothetical protein
MRIRFDPIAIAQLLFLETGTENKRLNTALTQHNRDKFDCLQAFKLGYGAPALSRKVAPDQVSGMQSFLSPYAFPRP